MLFVDQVSRRATSHRMTSHRVAVVLLRDADEDGAYAAALPDALRVPVLTFSPRPDAVRAALAGAAYRAVAVTSARAGRLLAEAADADASVAARVDAVPLYALAGATAVSLGAARAARARTGGAHSAAALAAVIVADAAGAAADPVLFLCSTSALDVLPAALAAAGVPCAEAVAYDAAPAAPAAVAAAWATAAEAAAAAGASEARTVVVFFSPAGVRAALAAPPAGAALARGARAVAIGASTAGALRAAGVHVAAVAESPDAPGVAAAVALAAAAEGAAPPPPASYWEGVWRQATAAVAAPRFDVGGAHAELVRALAAGEIPPGRALVPGCGRGYDVVALAAPDRVAIGVDISETGVAEARAYLERALPRQRAAEGSGVHCADFFGLATAGGPAGGPVDAVYDYTFLCALPPSLRGAWAAAMAALVRPGGVLLTLQFPIRPSEAVGYSTTHPAGSPLDFTAGPPFLLTPSLYHELLDGAFECAWERAVPDADSPPLRAGLERVALWRRRA